MAKVKPKPGQKPGGKPGKPRPNIVQKANANARGDFTKNTAKWKKQQEAKLNGIRSRIPAGRRRDQAIANAKTQMAARKPKKPTLGGELAQEYGWAHAVLMSDPELKRLFAQAVNQEWAPARFRAKMQATKWYQGRSEREREAETERLTDPESWKERVSNTTANLREAAMEFGADLDDTELGQIVNFALVEKWTDARIKQWFATKIDLTSNGGLFGKAGKSESDLQAFAAKYGVNYPASFFQTAARNIMSDTSSIEEYEDQIKALSASTYPGWASKIMVPDGQSVQDMAAPYKASMQTILEIPEGEISLQDPTLRKAITNTTAEGDPNVSPVWAFEKALRQDSRWAGTKNAQKTAASSGMNILKEWGLVK